LIQVIFDLAHESAQLENRIEALFEVNVWSFSKTAANSLLVYKVYLERIQEFPNEARKLMKKFISTVHNPLARHPLDVYSHEKAVFILSLQKDQVGTILDASGSAQVLFQTEKKKIIGQNLTGILSNIFTKNHMHFLNSASKHLSHRIQHRERTYGKTQDGNLFELHIQFQLSLKLIKKLKF